ncbi:phage virion morphogenesis protein [Salmonella enterica]|uniref:phage virion morphogenesis protein n=1 Tax=Enterobacteriaceae TaxID=543 RepID=UPI001076FF11|nr:phage virion morphogenesis protein [Enterobacter asburiae]EAB1947888.1 phage virion morphogenesis protein [Salmonella enterica]ECS8252144.1 phage virion morphogenesis protein [Salmonella enterica subsp. enterica serovar Waycross]EDV5018393.1 phage virion morphogenesis protein [Salmonella enterica subsp. enterica serovar Apapa]ELM2198565.1 phage virion morphogenesis protein [Citrobacter freundii]EAM3848369.1 phage virion morphogenesis protein [Salmonella enterica]
MSIDLAVVVDIRRIQTAFMGLGAMANDGDIPRAAAAALLSSTEQAFEQESDPETGAHWAAWSDPYLAWREKHNYIPGSILTLNGDLARSITTDYGPDWALIGSPMIYAAIHQWGGKARYTVLEARPYMGLDKVGRKEIYAAIKKRAETALKP